MIVFTYRRWRIRGKESFLTCWKVSLIPRLYSGQNLNAGGTSRLCSPARKENTHTLLFAGTRKLQLSLLLVRKLCSLGMSKAVHCSPSRVAHTDSGGLPPDTSTIPKRLRVIARGRQESMNRGASFRRQLNPRSVDLPITNDDSCAGGNRKRRRF